MAEYNLSYDEYSELSRRLSNDPGARYGFVSQGTNTYIARGPDEREARRQIEIALKPDKNDMPQDPRRIAATVHEQRNAFSPFNSQRSRYILTTDDPQVMDHLRQMGVQPTSQPSGQTAQTQKP